MPTPDYAQLQRFDVEPTVPDALALLRTIAHNLWWSWQSDAVALFIELDPDLKRQRPGLSHEGGGIAAVNRACHALSSPSNGC